MPQSTICTQASALTSHMVLRSPPSCYIPKLVYGTAWKKNKTEGLVYKALKYGYRGIDTAAQPKHYDEPGVGAGVKRAIAEDHAHREDLFIQTKFSPPSAQDENTPYDINAPLVDKVHQSIQSSLRNFTVSSDEPYLDSVVMHSPLDTLEETLTVWKTLETYTPKSIRSLGISNTTLPILKAIYENATVKPAVVQNRFHEPTHYEVELRAWCREKGIIFQSFWTVTANPQLVKSSPVQEVAQSVGVSRHVAYISLVMGLKGITVLDGSTKDAHMKANLDGIEKVGIWTQCGGSEKWLSCLQDFKSLINETS